VNYLVNFQAETGKNSALIYFIPIGWDGVAMPVLPKIDHC